MGRPTQNPIDMGSQTWGQDITDEFTKLFGGPLPVYRVADEAALFAVSPSNNEDCLVMVLSTREMWKSDGTEWRRFGKGQIDAHGARATRVVKEVHLTGLAGPTVTSAGFFPAGSINRCLSLRVTTTITGATSFDVGDGTTQDMFAALVALAAGSTKTPADRNASPESIAAKDVVLTANGMDFTAGAVRLVGAYDELTAPTS